MARRTHAARPILRLLALLAATTLAAVLAAAALTVALSRGWERERLRTLVEELADRALALDGLDARLRIGALEGPLYPSLALREVRLDLAGETVARAARLGIRLDARGLWRERKLVLERVELAGAELWLRRDPSRGWPWEASRPGGASRPLAVEVQSLRVSQTHLVLEFDELQRPSRLSGTLELEARGLAIPREGRPAWPTLARGRWQLGSSLVAGRALRSADLSFVLEGSRLHVAPAVLDADFGRGRLEATADLAGWIEPDLPAALSLDGDAEDLDLGVLLARPELAGAVAGHLTARLERPGNTAPSGLRVDGAVKIRASRVGALQIETAEIRGRLGEGRFELARASVDSSLGRLRASGRGSFERADACDLELELADLDALATLAGHPGTFAGGARLSARLSGPWDALRGEVSLQASRLRVGAVRLGTLETRLRAEGAGRLVLDPLRLTGGDWPVSGEGPISLRRVAAGLRFEAARLRLLDEARVSLAGDLDRRGARSLRIDLRDLPLAPVGVLTASRQPLGGRLDATLVADGAWPRPALQGSLDWHGPRVGEAHAERLETSFTTERGLLRGEARLDAYGRSLVLARFTTPWDARFAPARMLERSETRLSADAHGFDLSLLGGVLPPSLRDLHGQADLALELAGGMPRPKLSGELVLADVRCELAALGQHLGPLAGRLTLENDSLRVESLRLAGGTEGEALLAGRIALAGFAPTSTELELVMHRFPFQYAGRLRADLEGRILLAGPEDALVAHGELVLGKARYLLTGQRNPVAAEISVRNDPSQPPRAQDGPFVQKAPDLYRRSRVDVQLEIPPDGRVVGEGAEVRIRGLLRARKAPLRDLALEGSVETLGGTYRIRGKSFDLQPGRVVFTGRPDFDPDLDLRATHRVRDVMVIALLRGRGSNPKIRLESEPPRPENDLLALLLFGRTREELSHGESGALQALLAQTAGGAALQELRTITGLPLPLDIFEVRATEEGTGSTVGVGAHLTRDVSVHFGKGLGETAGSQLGLDWRFAPPHWGVETRSTTDRGSSADLVWTYDY